MGRSFAQWAGKIEGEKPPERVFELPEIGLGLPEPNSGSSE